MDKTANIEKNASAIKETPSHIHGSFMARKITLANENGRKSFTSPTRFMARVTHSSPPVPAHTTKNKSIASRIVRKPPSCAEEYSRRRKRRGKSRRSPPNAAARFSLRDTNNPIAQRQDRQRTKPAARS